MRSKKFNADFAQLLCDLSTEGEARSLVKNRCVKISVREMQDHEQYDGWRGVNIQNAAMLQAMNAQTYIAYGPRGDGWSLSTDAEGAAILRVLKACEDA